jgi:hypothetical protein
MRPGFVISFTRVSQYGRYYLSYWYVYFLYRFVRFILSLHYVLTMSSFCTSSHGFKYASFFLLRRLWRVLLLVHWLPSPVNHPYQHG